VVLDNEVQKPDFMFVAPLTTKRDEGRHKFMLELLTKDCVNGSCYGGVNSYTNVGRHDPLKKGNSRTTDEIS